MSEDKMRLCLMTTIINNEEIQKQHGQKLHISEGELLDLAVKYDIVDKSGAWFSYKGERLGQGRENVKELLRTNPNLASEIEKQVRELL